MVVSQSYRNNRERMAYGISHSREKFMYQEESLFALFAPNFVSVMNKASVLVGASRRHTQVFHRA